MEYAQNYVAKNGEKTKKDNALKVCICDRKQSPYRDIASSKSGCTSHNVLKKFGKSAGIKTGLDTIYTWRLADNTFVAIIL